MFWDFRLESIRMLHEALLYGYQRLTPIGCQQYIQRVLRLYRLFLKV
jgi:hypothetical protein